MIAKHKMNFHNFRKLTVTYSNRFIKNYKQYKYMYLLILPGMIILLLFDYYPLYFLQVAFKKYSMFKGITGSPWCGLQNFVDLFDSKYFMQAFENTVILSLMNRLFAFPVPILFALLINELTNKYYKRTVQTLIYLPHFLSWVIVGGIWINLLSPNRGIVNEMIKMIGFEPIYFMAEKKLFRWVLLFTQVWKESGWGTIVYLAAIAGINIEIYEASIIDGANRFKQIIYITLPSIIPTIIVVFILSLAKVLNLFDQVFVMYNPVVAEVSETIDTYVYQIGIVRGETSFAVAVGLFKNVISLSLILITNAIVKKYQGYSII